MNAVEGGPPVGPAVLAGALDPIWDLLGPAEVHLAAAVARLCPGTAAEVLQAVAFAARAPRLGHVCASLADLPWPDPSAGRAALTGDAAVVRDPGSAGRIPLAPLVLDDDRVYLQRYWRYEVAVADALLARARRAAGTAAAGAGSGRAEALAQALDRHFAAGASEQRRAAEVALGSGLAVIAGGPGTGKTTTVAGLLAAAADLARATASPPPRVALAAPTGKAAARMTEAVGEVAGDLAGAATTIHSLLGWAPGAGFAHHGGRHLEADLVVIDETSMVDLSLMAHLLDAVNPDTTLVLVGDPHQLASVEAGTVLGDVVAAASQRSSPLSPHLCELTRVHRFGPGSAIAALATAIRLGDAQGTLDALGAGRPVQLSLDDDGDDAIATGWVDPGDAVGTAALTGRLAAAGLDTVRAAREGDTDAALEAATRVKLLAATRRGPAGLYAWSDRIEVAVAERLEEPLRRGERWYPGRPVLVGVNDPLLGVANGDVGVVVEVPSSEGGPPEAALAMRLADGLIHLPPARVEGAETWWAMTIHKSQGSEFPEVIVSLPGAPSPALSRELLYTAVTRASRAVTVVADPDAVAAAVTTPVARASGLAERLGGG